MPQVASVLTPMSQGAALGVLLAVGCPRQALLMAAAQSAVETAGWKSMRGYNAGNITATNPSVQPWMLQGSNAIKFVAYPTPQAGFGAFLGWLSTHGLLAHAGANDLTGYMAQLRSNCYLGCIGRVDANGTTVSQTDYDNYQAGIAAWMTKLRAVAPILPADDAVNSASGGKGTVIALAILALGGAVAYAIHEGILIPAR